MPEEDEVSLYDYIKVVSKRKWLIIIGTFACILTAAIVTLFLPRVYETRTTLTMVGLDTPDVKIGVLKIPTGLSLDKFFNFLPDDRNLDLEVIRKLGLDKSPHNLTPPKLSQMITFSLARDSRMITINVRYSHPGKAKDIANTMAEVVKDQYQVLNTLEVSQFQNVIDGQLDLVKTSLVEVEKNLRVFKQTMDVDFLKKEILSRSSQETNLAQEYSKIRMLLVEEEARLTRAQEELQKQDRFYVLSRSIVEDPAYRKILPKLSKEDIDALQAAKGESYEINPIYLNLEEIVTNARISIAGTKAKELLLKEKIEENRLALSKLRTQLAEREPEWESLTAVHDLAKEDYQSIRSAHRGAVKLLVVAKARQLKIVGTAATPSGPIEPKTKRIILIAAVVGLLAALFLAFFLEYLEKMRRVEAESRRQKD